ncbi:hypothetical protein ABZS96_38205 [Streptomyces avermitilis]|uniref:hypothetical protein n=1 Tax=Streptomyces avermitilis TaxID=33903 RepID=UPI0033B57A01
MVTALRERLDGALVAARGIPACAGEILIRLLAETRAVAGWSALANHCSTSLMVKLKRTRGARTR